MPSSASVWGFGPVRLVDAAGNKLVWCRCGGEARRSSSFGCRRRTRGERDEARLVGRPTAGGVDAAGMRWRRQTATVMRPGVRREKPDP